MIEDAEILIIWCSVIPNAPNEQRENGDGILAQKLVHVENHMIIERYGHANIVQRRTETLQILDGVGIRVKDIRIGNDFLRRQRSSLDEEIIISIHASNHVLAHLLRKQVHEHRLLSALQLKLTRRQHHLEISPVILKPTQHGAPEEHVIIALDVSDNPTSRVFRIEFVRRLEIP